MTASKREGEQSSKRADGEWPNGERSSSSGLSQDLKWPHTLPKQSQVIKVSSLPGKVNKIAAHSGERGAGGIRGWGASIPAV